MLLSQTERQFERLILDHFLRCLLQSRLPVMHSPHLIVLLYPRQAFVCAKKNPPKHPRPIAAMHHSAPSLFLERHSSTHPSAPYSAHPNNIDWWNVQPICSPLFDTKSFVGRHKCRHSMSQCIQIQKMLLMHRVLLGAHVFLQHQIQQSQMEFYKWVNAPNLVFAQR